MIILIKSCIQLQNNNILQEQELFKDILHLSVKCYELCETVFIHQNLSSESNPFWPITKY